METDTRYIGLDIHKSYVMVAGVDKQQTVLFKPQKVAVERFGEWVHNHLNKNDKVALEATSNAWEFHDQLLGQVGAVTVANAHKLKLISSSRVKTDRQDALVLAKLLAANLVPSVWVPPQPVRELRALVAHRQQLVRERSAGKNRLHSLLHRHNIVLPGGSAFTKANQACGKT